MPYGMEFRSGEVEEMACSHVSERREVNSKQENSVSEALRRPATPFPVPPLPPWNHIDLLFDFIYSVVVKQPPNDLYSALDITFGSLILKVLQCKFELTDEIFFLYEMCVELESMLDDEEDVDE